MTIRSYLLNLFFGTILAFFGLFSFIVSVNPETFFLGIGISFFIFYFLFFLSVVGASIVAFTWLYEKMAKDNNLGLGELSLAVRQGILLGILLTIFLFLQQMRWFFWWDASLLLFGMILVEFNFLTKS